MPMLVRFFMCTSIGMVKNEQQQDHTNKKQITESKQKTKMNEFNSTAVTRSSLGASTSTSNDASASTSTSTSNDNAVSNRTSSSISTCSRTSNYILVPLLIPIPRTMSIVHSQHLFLAVQALLLNPMERVHKVLPVD